MAPGSAFDRISTAIQRFEDSTNMRWQIGLAAGALCFALVSLIALAAASVARDDARDAASEQMSETAFILADRIDRGIASRLGLLRLISGIQSLRSEWLGDPSQIRQALDLAQSTTTGTAWLGFATSDGIVHAAAGGLLEGRSVADQAWFQRGLKGAAFEDVREPKLLAPMPGLAPDGQPRHFIEIATPVADARGTVIGVLGLQIGWQWLEEYRRATLERLTSSRELWLLGADGSVLLGPYIGEQPFSADEITLMKKGGQGAFVDRDGDGGPMVTGYAVSNGAGDFPGLGWIVIARQATSVAFARGREIVWTIVLLGAALASVGVILAIGIAGRVSRPIVVLTEEADRIGRHSVEMLPRIRGSQEVARLSSALRSLVLRLGFAEQRHAEAEARAAEEARKFSRDIATLRSLADTDPLTRLLNRRSFMNFAEAEMDHYSRHRRPFAILMTDIDNFKRVNDQHGHLAGDVAIRHVASVIDDAIRPSDRAGRFGGEEFVILLREISEGDALAIAERIRAEVAANPAKFNNDNLAVTISIGVAIVDDGDRDLQDTIERADLALYSAKTAGRNIVRSSGANIQRLIA